jgi:glycosyltransferase involved in cell wall biosynthesis
VNDQPPVYRGAVYLVADHPWPSTSGGRARDASRAAALATLGPVTVLALDTPEPPAAWARGMARYWRRRRRQVIRIADLSLGILRGNHVALERATAAGLTGALEAVLADLRPSVVVLGRPFFGSFIAVARRSGACVIVDADESLDRVSRSVLRSQAPVAARTRALLDLLAVGRMERRDFPTADEVWAGSETERQALSRVAAPAEVRVVPNVAPRASAHVANDPGPIRQVAFVGSYSHPPNEEAALELVTSIMPAIRAAGGPVELVLIGRDPTSRMSRVAAGDAAVTIAANVVDVGLPLASAGVLVMPIRSGGGSRIKALEAVAVGVPVVSTSFGIAGLELRPGIDVLVAETARDFADAVSRLRAEPALRASLVASARESVAAHHSPAAVQAAVVAAVAACPPGR